jgi:hypothetical protein
VRGQYQQEVVVPRSSNAPVHPVLYLEAVTPTDSDLAELLQGDSVSFDLEPVSATSHIGQYVAVPSSEVDGWIAMAEARAAPAAEDELGFECPPELRAATDAVLHAWEDVAPTRFGQATRTALRPALDDAMRWVEESFDASKGTLETFASSIIRLVERRFAEDLTRGDAAKGFALLRMEHADEVARDAARASEHRCAGYLLTVRNIVLEYSRRLGQKSENATEHADAVVMRVLECLREPGDGFIPYLQPGRPSWWRISNAIRTERRRRDRMWLVRVPSQLPYGHILPADVALSKKRLEAKFEGRVDEILRPHLSKTQRRYLDAIIVEIQLASAERDTDRIRGVPARVAERLGKDPSQVSRAIKRIAKIATDLGLEDFVHLAD